MIPTHLNWGNRDYIQELNTGLPDWVTFERKTYLNFEICYLGYLSYFLVGLMPDRTIFLK